MSIPTIDLYLDDERQEPNGWVRATTFTDAVREMQVPGRVVQRLSLDHDLGICADCGQGPCHHTGYLFALWCAEHGFWSVQKPTVHSMNPVGRKNMQSVIDRYWRDPWELFHERLPMELDTLVSGGSDTIRIAHGARCLSVDWDPEQGFVVTDLSDPQLCGGPSYTEITPQEAVSRVRSLLGMSNS